MGVSLKISVVDQSPIFSNTNANSAIRETIELAKFCDSIGMHRFWVAEHHGSDSFAGCSPEIFIPFLCPMVKLIIPSCFPKTFPLVSTMFPGSCASGLKRSMTET